MRCLAKESQPRCFHLTYDFMTDKKNIVIKVSYPVTGKSTGKSAPKTITEWNIKRILLAAGTLILVLILASLFYITGNNPQKTDLENAELVNTIEKQTTPQIEAKKAEIKNSNISGKTIIEPNASVISKEESNTKNKQATDITIKKIIKKQPNKKIIKEHEYLHNVSRTSLTYKIINKEPTDEIVRTVKVSQKNPTWVYYFTELKGMNGNKVYHEWLKNGVIISRQKLAISGDIWRTSSRKLLSDSESGKWTVRLIDENSRLLDEKSFKVE